MMSEVVCVALTLRLIGRRGEESCFGDLCPGRSVHRGQRRPNRCPVAASPVVGPPVCQADISVSVAIPCGRQLYLFSQSPSEAQVMAQ